MMISSVFQNLFTTTKFVNFLRYDVFLIERYLGHHDTHCRRCEDDYPICVFDFFFLFCVRIFRWTLILFIGHSNLRD